MKRTGCRHARVLTFGCRQAPRPSSTCSRLVLLVTMQITLCSLWLSAGPGRARRRPRWHVFGWFCW